MDKAKTTCRLLPFAFALGIASLAAGCQVEYHPYDTRIRGDEGINARNIVRIESACAGKTTLRFAVISDTQRRYDETREAVELLNRRNDLDFVLHAGDIADFGMRAEFERQRDILNALKVPYLVLIGNHDCLATGEEIFTRIFGAVNFAFTAGDVRFICLNTNSLEYDHNSPVPDFGFLGREITEFPAAARKTVVAMHADPLSEQFDRNVAPFFQYTIRQFPDLQCCIHGHGHRFRAADLFDDGVMYYECADAASRSVLIFTIHDKGYDYEKVDF